MDNTFWFGTGELHKGPVWLNFGHQSLPNGLSDFSPHTSVKTNCQMMRAASTLQASDLFECSVWWAPMGPANQRSASPVKWILKPYCIINFWIINYRERAFMGWVNLVIFFFQLFCYSLSLPLSVVLDFSLVKDVSLASSIGPRHL